MTQAEYFAGVLLTLGAYLAGCFLASYYLPLWLRGVDVTAAPADHNPGAANAFSAVGPGFGAVCLCCDLLKGALPVALGVKLLGLESPWLAPILAAPVVGHALPLFRRGRGGKAIAVSFGCLAGLWPLWGPLWLLIGLYLTFSLVVVISPHAARSVLTYGLWLLAMLYACPVRGVRLGCLLIGLVVIGRHLYAARGAEKEKPRVTLFRRA